jgi:hypothetical protein
VRYNETNMESQPENPIPDGMVDAIREGRVPIVVRVVPTERVSYLTAGLIARSQKAQIMAGLAIDGTVDVNPDYITVSVLLAPAAGMGPLGGRLADLDEPQQECWA